MVDEAEQRAFEEWAVSEGMDMRQHPLHYLFLDEKTRAARQAWNAAIRFARRAAQPPAPSQQEGKAPYLNHRAAWLRSLADDPRLFGHDDPEFGSQLSDALYAGHEALEQMAALRSAPVQGEDHSEAYAALTAIRQRHNGYNAEMRAAMPDLKEPASPAEALDDLLDEERKLSMAEADALARDREEQ